MKEILVLAAIMSLIACDPSGHDSASKGIGMPSNFSTWSSAESDKSLHPPSSSNASSGGIVQPPIFKISSRPGGPVSYLLGTVHMAVALSELPKWVLNLHDKTNVHAYEINLVNEMHEFRASRNDKNFGTLSGYKDEDIINKRNNFSDAEVGQLVKLGFPVDVARTIPDKKCSVLATRKWVFRHDRYDSIDLDLEDRTVAAKKQLVELESTQIRKEADEYAKNLGFVDTCSIRELLHDPKKLKAADLEVENMFNFYRSMTVADLVRMPSRPADDDPSTAYRNRIWVPKIVQLINSQSTFIAVGYMHLIGPDGLIQLLRAQGYLVEPLVADVGA